MNRRDFLKQSALAPLATDFFATASADPKFKDMGSCVGGLVVLSMDAFLRGKMFDYQFARADLATGKVNTLSLDFAPHSVVRSPINHDHAVAVSLPDYNDTFGIHGDYTRAALLDIKNCELIRYISAAKDRYFYGHAALLKNENLAYFNTDTYDSLLRRATSYNDSSLDLIDLDTGKLLDRIELGGGFVHDLIWDSTGQYLVAPKITIRDGFEVSRLQFIQPHDKKVVREILFEKSNYMFGHYQHTTEKSSFVGASTLFPPYQHSVILFASESDSHFKRVAHPPQITERIRFNIPLDLCFHPETKVTAISWPQAKFVSFYNSETGEFIKHLDFVMPTAIMISQDRKYFVIQACTYFHFIDAHTLIENHELYYSACHFKQVVVGQFKHGLNV